MPPSGTGWDGFKAPQVYSIEIEQGMIGSNILEGHFLGRQYGRSAEIAILANVFEFAGKAEDAAARRFLETGETPGTADDPSDVELKLVYFGDNVLRRQAFNFSNIPLRERSEYGGGSIGIQIVIMEVDAQAGPVASLLTTLARFGQQLLPGPGEAKDMLFDLGESLLSGSQDDKLFEYRFVLSAAGDNPRAAQATFAPGRYVLMRKQRRDEEMGWSALRLDHNTARLFEKSADPTLAGYRELREDLYLVLNVRRYPANTKPEFYSPLTWSSFRTALQAAADTNAAPLDRVTENLQTLLGKERSSTWRAGLSRQWAAAEDRLHLYSARYLQSFAVVEDSTCPVTANELERRRDEAERGAADALRRFVTNYKEAMAVPVKDKDGKEVGQEFTASDREQLLSMIATYFMPWASSGTQQDKFKDAAAFETAFMVEAAAPDLVETALAAARAKGSGAKSCLDLVAR
jgi:hypothetical protein